MKMINQCPSGVYVTHAVTGARGFVLSGGYRPRVRWEPNNRIKQMDVEELRVIECECWQGTFESFGHSVDCPLPGRVEEPPVRLNPEMPRRYAA